ncbi:hypothetical protein DFQ27_006775 [Actinomortierella ambigua]|uniref:Dynamin-type G domain-containing protein n=1 Tax=Actinomortierella ambigua TaxID=1343610 RepID=A0A9P6QGS8_9FUNG|nr:hypothetical protein DFQ27_006775 [Actinomortierella ambigua]
MFSLDSSYQSIIDQIYKIRSDGVAGKLSIPRLAIIGDQSSGKSSTLESFTQLPFPHGEGMCTRFAIQVNMRRDVSLKEDQLSASIDGEIEFNKKHEKGASRAEFRSVIDDATKILCSGRVQISEKMLEITLRGPTQAPLTLVDLPGFINMSLDAHGEDLPKTIREINRRYIKESRTIILAVIPASNDFENSAILNEAKLHDPTGERTIPIITKPDLMRESKQWMSVILNKSKSMPLGYLVMCNKTYDDDKTWDYARAKEAEFFKSGMWSKVDPQRKGRLAVKSFLGRLLYDHICKEMPAFKKEVRSALNKYKSDLNDMGVPIADKAVAREMLKTANLKLQVKVNRFLNADYDPSYIAAYWKKKKSSAFSSDSDDGEETEDDEGGKDGDDDADGEDGESGEDDGDDDASESRRGRVRRGGEEPYFVRASLLRLYHEYRTAMRDDLKCVSYDDTVQQVALYKGYELPGFTSFTTFKNVYNGHYLPGWRTVTDAYVDRMHSHLTEALRGFIKHATDASTFKVFAREFNRFSREQEEKIRTTVSDIFDDEEVPFTLNRHFVEAVHKERSKNNRIPALPIELSVTEKNEGRSARQASASAFGIIGSNPPLQMGSPPTPPQQRPPPLGQSQVAENDGLAYLQKSQPNSDWNDMLTTKEMVPCMLAYLTTAIERIVDKVLMETIERHMIRRIDEYFHKMCNIDDEALEPMLEPPALGERRAELYKRIAEYERLLDEL